MTTTAQIHELDAHDQAALVRGGELSARELVEASIARIEQIDRDINAVTVRRFEQALTDTTAPVPDSAVAGVPMLLKELGPPCAGTETTVGSRFLAGFVPGHDGELVHRMRRAGLVVLGKTNTAEFGVLPTTEPEFRGPTRNPAAPSRSAGGSSGAPPPRLLPAWSPSRTPTTRAARFASRPRAAGCSGSSPPGPEHRWAPTSVT